MMFARYYCENCSDQTLHRWSAEIDDRDELIGRPVRCCQCHSRTYVQMGVITLTHRPPQSRLADFVDFTPGTTAGTMAGLLTFLTVVGALVFVLLHICLGVQTGRW